MLDRSCRVSRGETSQTNPPGTASAHASLPAGLAGLQGTNPPGWGQGAGDAAHKGSAGRTQGRGWRVELEAQTGAPARHPRTGVAPGCGPWVAPSVTVAELREPRAAPTPAQASPVSSSSPPSGSQAPPELARLRGLVPPPALLPLTHFLPGWTPPCFLPSSHISRNPRVGVRLGRPTGRGARRTSTGATSRLPASPAGPPPARGPAPPGTRPLLLRQLCSPSKGDTPEPQTATLSCV